MTAPATPQPEELPDVHEEATNTGSTGAAALGIAHRLGRYTLHTRLAMGGMAEVWLARQAGPAGFSKDLVVKRILPAFAHDEEFVDMFLNEARLAAQLNHPNVVQIFDLGVEDGTYYIVMELISGCSLRLIDRGLRVRDLTVPLPILAKVLADTCEGLHYAHELKDTAGRPLSLVHRDISPDNVLVSFDGVPKIVDFGIARAATIPRLTRAGAMKGKYAYMSPEQLRGRPLDRRADVYSLGVVLYEILAGRKPCGTDEMGLLEAFADKPPVPLSEARPDAPAALVAVVEKAMAKQAADRYPDARAMGRDLKSFLRSLGDEGDVGVGEVAAFMHERFAGERAALQSAIANAPVGDTSKDGG